MTMDGATRARLVGLFVAEAEESVSELARLSERLQAGADGPAVAEFGRVAHGLKGAASALGFEALARMLHALEDLALGIPRAPGPAADERRARIDQALRLLEEGLARMSAAGLDAFPADLLPHLAEVTGAGLDAIDAPAAQGPGGPAHEPATVERLNVPAADVDAALRLAAAIARGAAQLHEALVHEGGGLTAPAQGLAASAHELEGIIASLRLLPAEAALSGLEAEVSALAARLGKRVSLALSGHDVKADRRTLQAALGMIRHLIRNAVDHGIESPDVRRAAGKPEAGRLAVTVEAAESSLRVTVVEDGAGFDVPTIRAELARRDGGDQGIAALSDEEVLHRWAFEGGSTREAATSISGRGLGLSAVAQLARAAGGGIHLRSARGAGSRIVFTLPLEVYSVDVLIVIAGGLRYGIPLRAVEQTVHLAAGGEVAHEGPAGRTLAVGEAILALSSLRSVVGGPGAAGADRFAVVIRADDAAVAIGVEDIGAVAGLVPEGVPGVAQPDALVTGLSRLGDGAVVSVLNPRLLVARARAIGPRLPQPARPAGAGAGAGADAPGPTPERAGREGSGALEVVLAEDSLATREVLRVLLEEQGFRVRVAADGEEALQRIAERLPDALVTDVNMPRRDGLALTRELRRQGATARLPVVLLTSQDDDATRAAGAAAGADAYLLKSRFDAGVLKDTLARLGVRPR